MQLGFVSTVGFDPLPGWLRGLRERHPGMTVELRESTSDVQLAAFAQEALDAGFVLHAPGLAGSGDGARAFVGRRRAAGTGLAGRTAVGNGTTLEADELLAQPLVIFPRDIAPSLHDAVLAFYHRHGATPVIAQQAIQMQTIVNLVSAGLGLALVPQAVTLLQRPGVVYRPLPAALQTDAPRCETSLVWRAPASPAVARFVAFVREHL